MLNQLILTFRKNIRSYIMIIALALIWLGFGIATPSYWSADHIQNIFTQMAIIAIMACGMLFVIVIGGIDLSVGYGAGFISVVAAALLYYQIVENPLAAMGLSGSALEVVTAIIVVILCLILSILIGMFQGGVIAYLAVPAFITTLGGMFIWKSGILLVTQGKSLFISKNTTYKYIAQGYLPPIVGYVIAVIVIVALFLSLFSARKRKAKYGIQQKNLVWEITRTAIFSILILGYVVIVNRTFDPSADPSICGVPFLVVLLGAIGVLMHYVSSSTRFGRYAYAIGGNREAARLSGIDIKKNVFGIHIVMGLLMGVSGVALAAYVGSGTTGAGGGYELDVIASCILGGTSPLGGEGTIVGALIGALVMQSLSNGLQMLNVNSNYQYMIKGLILILAVWADITMKKKKA
jgi:D-xylose transport system permease protein